MPYLISYAWRRPGEAWRFANAVTKKTPSEWLLKTKTKEYIPEEYILLSATPITEEEFDKLDEKL